MNLMILSPGRRCELVRYFKEALHQEGAKVIALDMNKYAPALYFADKHYVVKKNFNNLVQYIEDVIKICKDEEVTFLITLIDPELKLLSQHRREFEDNNINLILSDDSVIEATLDKCLFYQRYNGKLKLAKTYSEFRETKEKIVAGEVGYPLIAKPRYGSASIGAEKINTEDDLEAHKLKRDYAFQEFIEGKELGIDVYFDMISGKIISVFMKEKIAMRAGETDKAVSVFRKDVLQEIQKLDRCGGFRGPIDVDAFVDRNGLVYINEINPRFGAGYAHAHYCGVDFVKLVVNNMNGKTNNPTIGKYRLGVEMMKYNNFLFKCGEEIHAG